MTYFDPQIEHTAYCPCGTKMDSVKPSQQVDVSDEVYFCSATCAVSMEYVKCACGDWYHADDAEGPSADGKCTNCQESEVA